MIIAVGLLEVGTKDYPHIELVLVVSKNSFNVQSLTYKAVAYVFLFLKKLFIN